MKNFVSFSIAVFLFGTTYSQKLSIDTSDFNKWQMVSQPAISNDGNYFLFTISNKPFGNQTLIVKSLHGDWQKNLLEPQTLFLLKKTGELFLFPMILYTYLRWEHLVWNMWLTLIPSDFSYNPTLNGLHIKPTQEIRC